jgi:hypothetical protein
MIPDPGPQNSIPYFLDALWRKSKTSFSLIIERCKRERGSAAVEGGQSKMQKKKRRTFKSASAPSNAEIKWSQ